MQLQEEESYDWCDLFFLLISFMGAFYTTAEICRSWLQKSSRAEVRPQVFSGVNVSMLSPC